VDWKGTHLALRAFAALHQRVPASEYWIVGDGPVRVHLEEVVQRLGLGSAVVFKGWLPRDRLLDTFGQCDVAIHPSLHESGGWVCAEAMAAGRPVVCLALGGPGLQVTATTGFAIAAATADAAVEAMGVALVRLASDFALRQLMGEAARDRAARAYRWDDRGEFINSLYAAVTASPTVEPRSSAIHSRSVLASSRSSEGAGAPYDGC
jgi:glycosyltransferase involved in cell wall biosynthesis